MTQNDAVIDDLAGASHVNEHWDPVIITGRRIDEEAVRLAASNVADPGARQVRFAHPRACGRGRGLAPGIEVRLAVLNPGERTAPTRCNATEVGFCIKGRGRVHIGDRSIDYKRYDVWNQPSWLPVVHENPYGEPQVRLCYSNAALLRLLNVFLDDEKPPMPAMGERQSAFSGAPHTGTGGDATSGAFQLGGGAWVMPYERLINPPPAVSETHHWPWADVKAELDKLSALGSAYKGRRLYLLYNRLTGRTNGTTPSFFATMTIRPPGIIDRPHRHVSAAINYYFKGAGYSRVAGKHYEWTAGDLMLSAPGWAIHNHASHPGDPVYELTVQDQPFHIAQESLLWQEELQHPPALLGVEQGFKTNREALEA